jgi:glyoxylase-like metal-dependent hydrolase (beta-lactamase superfamily II)
MSAPTTQQIEPGIFLIDHRFLGVPGVIASYLVADGDDLALIETGPTTTLETLLEGVRACGYDPEAITRVLVTHIHLDHAGSAGVLLQRLPRARFHVHPVGAPHMVDPSKLLVSATRIYGDRMQQLWGEILPVPQDRLEITEDGAEIRVGRRVLRALDTPGHAFHHLAFHEPEVGAVFTGDVAAVRLGGSSYVRPPTPPPELDLELWMQSVARLRALDAQRLLLTHFGAYDDVDRHLDELLARLFGWAGWVEARLAQEPDTTRIAAELREKGDAEIRQAMGEEGLPQGYELATNYQMTVDGYARYFRKRSGEGGRK